jgi:hypothetical protein
VRLRAVSPIRADLGPSFVHSYGVIHDYYLHHEPFMTQPGPLAAVSTTAMAIMLFGSPMVSLLLQRYPNLRIGGGCVGLAIIHEFLNGVTGHTRSHVWAWCPLGLLSRHVLDR